MKSVSVGLVGEGILSSKSPLLHQSEAESQNLNLSYELYDFLILKKTEKDLDTFLKTIELRKNSFTKISPISMIKLIKLNLKCKIRSLKNNKNKMIQTHYKILKELIRC